MEREVYAEELEAERPEEVRPRRGEEQQLLPRAQEASVEEGQQPVERGLSRQGSLVLLSVR